MMRRNAVVAWKKLLQHKEFGSKVQSVRESLRLWQDQFIRAIHEKKLKLQSLHAIAVGRDMKRLEMQLRKYVTKKKIQDRVHFVKETPALAPYPAFIDVPSKARGEYFGKITIEQGEKVKSTVEIEVIGTPGFMQSVATHVKKRLTMGKKACGRVKERFQEYHMSSHRNCSGSQGSFTEVSHKLLV
ncbi:hypothetical protein MtrunA17_Chr3g0141911 [Medicago truncatula]|uniref:Uncharacterized protein n=1 Tax=Medicago truncatula TaxID=3880 RepID=A0A396J6Z5_MEDTR|nr:uncharacterized protein LOC25490225 [Medicago truncatula]RHN71037.1 hypothetical protein MtrunA17_Chr3g0141911 [Medicago truncatula]